MEPRESTASSGLDRQVAHMVWADQRMLAALTVESFSELQALVSHILAAEHVWLRRLEGRTPDLSVWPLLDRDELTALAAVNAAGYAALLATDPDPARLVSYETSRGEPFETALGDILTHVTLHGSYHRGQVAQRLRQLGAVPAGTDFITFVRTSGE